MLHSTYSAIIEGSVHTQDEVIAWANGMVWSEINTTSQDIKHGEHITTVQGDVGVWYEYTGDYYFFTEEKELPY
jgi:hypothetical protein